MVGGLLLGRACQGDSPRSARLMDHRRNELPQKLVSPPQEGNAITAGPGQDGQLPVGREACSAPTRRRVPASRSPGGCFCPKAGRTIPRFASGRASHLASATRSKQDLALGLLDLALGLAGRRARRRGVRRQLRVATGPARTKALLRCARALDHHRLARGAALWATRARAPGLSHQARSAARSRAEAPAPTRYWLVRLPKEKAALAKLVTTAKALWRVEQDYGELKEELGLDHFEGRP